MANKPFYEEGNYVGEITEQAISAAGTGTPQIVLKVKILGTPSEDTYVVARNQYERSIYMSITDKTAQYVWPTLDTLGYPHDSFSQIEPSHPQHYSFVGKQVELYCKHKERQDLTLGESWSISRGPQPLKVNPVDSKDIRRLDALFGRSKVTGQRAAPAAIERPQFNPEITDDDIPF